MAWLAGAERITNYKGDGGTYVDAPWRVCLHTTEVIPTDLNGARGMAARHPNPPQLWAWPDKNWLAQTVQLEHSGFSLEHPAGTPETNKMRAIQVEVVGFADDTDTWPGWWWDWLGIQVVAPVIRAGYPINLDHVALATGNDGAGVNGSVRMTDREWALFDGICGHSSVPHNEHWDPGRANYRRIAAAARADLNPPRKVAPVLQPPWQTIDAKATPDGGCWLLGVDGGVAAVHSGLFYGSPVGQDYWQGRTAARFADVPTIPGGYSILSTNGQAYHYGPP